MKKTEQKTLGKEMLDNQNELNINQKTFTTMRFDDLKVVVGGAYDFFKRNSDKEEEEGSSNDLHSHIYYEIFFVLDAPLTVGVEGEIKEYVNKVVIVPPELEHYTSGYGLTTYRITVFDSVNGKTKSKIGRLAKDKVSVFDFNDNFKFYFENLIKIDLNSEKGRMKGEALARLILLELFELFSEIEIKSLRGGGDDKFAYLEKIDSFVNTHYLGNGAKLGALAKELFLSEKQVSRIIKREYGCSFPKLINDRRMLAATSLIKNSGYSISEIISMLEFESENYFYRLFKKYYKTTPLQFRKEYEKKKD